MTYTDTIDSLNNYFDIEGDEVSFKKHKLAQKALILPFSTKMEPSLAKQLSSDLRSFNGVVGEIYRFANDKKFPKRLTQSENFKAHLKEETLFNVRKKTYVSEEGANKRELEEKLTSIIKSLYFKDNDLIKYGDQAMPLLNWSHSHAGMKNIANFFLRLFINKDVKQIINNKTDESTHVLHQLMNAALPKLEDEYDTKKVLDYLVVNTEIIELFQADLKALTVNKKHFLQNINNLVKHYFFLYVSSLGIDLNNFFNSNGYTPLYFTLDSEAYTQSRKANQKGWKFLQPKISNLFSHAICLDLLNHISILKKPSSYHDIKEQFLKMNEEEQNQLIEDVRYISNTYIKAVPEPKEKKWSDFENYLNNKHNYSSSNSIFEKEILKLWHAIDFQFNYSVRRKPYLAYSNWFVEFCKANMLKNRGRNGYSLNIDSEMLLFLTKIAVGNKPKIRLKQLWDEFKKRGVVFDDASQRAVIDFFEKINLIEKKSDSGDAQYVKAIL